jgi:hypothetical protein
MPNHFVSESMSINSVQPGGYYSIPADQKRSSGLTYSATRIWIENEDGTVKYRKNRLHGTYQEVDMEEFFWVKLSAKPL